MTVTYTPEEHGGEDIHGGGGGLTKEERLEKAQEYAKKIREAEVEIKQLKLDVELLEQTGVDGYVRAAIDGVVSKVNDVEELSDGDTMITVKGKSGFYVRGTIDELKMESISVGQKLTGTVMDTGESCVGTVAEISSVPTGSDEFGGSGSNVSGYTITVRVEDSDQLTPGQYVEFIPEKNGITTGTMLYLMQAYVREIDGVKYIFKEENGKLAQIPVETGEIFYGYTQILGDVLTSEDYIAFPYGADVKDGAPVSRSGSLS